MEEDEVDDSETLADTSPEDEAMFIKSAGGFDPCQRPRRVSPPKLNVELHKHKKAVSLHSPLSPTPSAHHSYTVCAPSAPIQPTQASRRSERRSSYTPQLDLQRIQAYDDEPLNDRKWQPVQAPSSYLPRRQSSSASSTTCYSTLSPQSSFCSSNTSSPIATSPSVVLPTVQPEPSSRFFRSALRKFAPSSPNSPVPPRHATPPPPWSSSSHFAPASTDVTTSAANNSAVAAIPPAPTPTKSASLADKIKNRFQKKNTAPQGGGLPRSASLSSMTWNRLTTPFHGSRSSKKGNR